MNEQERKCPWPGPSSYDDPGGCEKNEYFYGRRRESHELVRLIENEWFATLYGNSGVGKTSLLKASVFPKLREKGFLPLYVRLGALKKDDSYQKYIEDELETALKNAEGRVEPLNYYDSDGGENDIEHLLYYFANRRFLSKDGNPIRPVFVFDQFEEVFREDNERVITLLSQICYLTDPYHQTNIATKDDHQTNIATKDDNGAYDNNYRFIFSIREDELYKLESCLNANNLQLLKQNRYYIGPLTKEGAKDVILKPDILDPDNYLFNTDDKNAVADDIISFCNNDGKTDVSSMLLSLICRELWYRHETVTTKSIAVFVKQNFLEQYYDKAVKNLTNSQKDAIETLLVSGGRRKFEYIEELKKIIPNWEHLTKGENAILKTISNDKIELIHDRFCEVLQKRKTERKVKRRIWRITTFFLFCFVFFLLVGYFLYQRIEERKRNHVRDIVNQINYAIEDEDFCLARLAALEAYDMMDCPETEAAIRKTVDEPESYVLYREASYCPHLSFNPNPEDKRLVTSGFDGNLIIWNYETGECIKTLETHDLTSATFSPDGKKLLAVNGRKGYYSSDHSRLSECILVLDAQTGMAIDTIKGHTAQVLDASFGPDGTKIISTAVDGTIRVWDTQGKELFKILEKPHFALHPLGYSIPIFSGSTCNVYSPDGKKLLSDFNDGTIDIWDIENRSKCLSIPTTSNSASFSQDGKKILSVNDSTIYVWDAETGGCIQTLQSHKKRVYTAVFSHDASKIVSTGTRIVSKDSLNDNTEVSFIQIWDIETGKCIMQRNSTSYMVYATFSPDGKQVAYATSDGCITIWNWNIQEERKPIAIDISNSNTHDCYALSPNGKFFADLYHQKYRIKDIDNDSLYDSIPTTTDEGSLAFSPDSRVLAFANNTSYNETKLQLFDIDKKEITSTLKLPSYTTRISQLAFGPLGENLYAIINNGIIGVWDLTTNDTIRTIDVKDSIKSIANFVLSRDEKILSVSSSSNDTIGFYHLENGSLSKSIYLYTHVGIPREGGELRVFSFCPNDNSLILTAKRNRLELRDLNSNKNKNYRGNKGDIEHAAFSHDGKLIVSLDRDGLIIVSDVESKVPLWTLDTKSDNVRTAAFTVDGTKLQYIVSDSLITKDWKPVQLLVNEVRKKCGNRKLTEYEKRVLHFNE